VFVDLRTKIQGEGGGEGKIIRTPSLSMSKQCGAKNSIVNGCVRVGCGEGNGLGLGDGAGVGRKLLSELFKVAVAEGECSASPIPSPKTLNTVPSLF